MTPRPRLLGIIGSGETAPTMAKVHRLFVERLGAPPVDAVLLDTPYGFQENADEISQRTVGYFRNLQIPFDVASWRTADDVLPRERALARIDDADYVFAGPGSPTYALGVWQHSRLRDVLVDKLTSGGCVAFASAAALTLGVATVPVYEIYKVGATPYWAAGMDLLAQAGLRAAVIPHYDNAEGGTHDTRFCYLGERRLQLLESMLETGTVVLGVDEHTAGLFDFDTDTVTVLGRAALTVRRQGVSTVFPSGATVAIDELRAIAAGGGPAIGTPSAQSSATEATGLTPSLRADADRLEQVFDTGLRARDVGAAVTAILELEQAIVDWSADTEEEDGAEGPRAMLRRMVTRLGELAAVGAKDPRKVVAPFVDTLLELRDQAREQGSWTLADTLRDRLTAAGIEVRDTPGGAVWLLADRPEVDGGSGGWGSLRPGQDGGSIPGLR
ncbi:MAG: CysS/YqeB C-terminal domain-containing protein [Pseudonocardiaceae bacterium]